MNKKDTLSINENLRNFQKQWYKEIALKWMQYGHKKDIKNYVNRKYGNENYSFSEPFIMVLPKHQNEQAPLLMIVGQETNGYGDKKDFSGDDKSFHASQEWATNFMNEQLNTYSDKNIYYSDFWKFIRVLKRKLNEKKGEINICWNNLDKIHYKLVDQNNCIKLYKEDEKYLNQVIPHTDKTLLQTEIDIVKPDAVLFVTGPNYGLSMKTALQQDNITEPTLDNPIVKINSNINMFWTYHPAAKFSKNVKEKHLEKIINSLSEVLWEK